MSLKCRVRVVLNNITDERAQTVRRALEPDNTGFPKDLSLEVKNVDNKLVFDFKSRGDMAKLIGTVDEVIEHVQVALRVTE